MNSAGNPPEAVPLQEKYEGFPGQPGGPGVVQHTTVNITTEPPKDHIIWSLFNLTYSNCFCLGLVAFIHSIKARDRKVTGDLEGARHYGSTARCFNIWATVLGCIGLLIFIIVFTVVTVQLPPHRRYLYRD